MGCFETVEWISIVYIALLILLIVVKGNQMDVLVASDLITGRCDEAPPHLLNTCQKHQIVC